VSNLPPRARLGILVAAVVLVLGGAAYAIFLRGDDDKPVTEAGSRFSDDGGGASSAPLTASELSDAGARRTGADPAPPSEDEIKRSPGSAVAGLMLVGFRGTLRDTPFLKRLAAIPYGGLLLTEANYEQPQQLSGLTAKLQEVARAADHPAPLIAAQQEGGEFNAFPNLAPEAQADVGEGTRDAIATSAKTAAGQLKALGIGVNLAPNADVAVAGGPGQGRAFADTPAAVTTAVSATVGESDKLGVAAVVGPFPGDGAASQVPNAGPAPVGLSLEDLRNADLKPFAAVATGDRAARAMQMTNAIYAAFDSVTPATLLPDAVKELRGRLGFDGAILSADLVATTATAGGNVGGAAVQALKAGVDMLVIPGGRAQQDQAYRAVVAAVKSGDISPGRIADALKRIAAVRAFTRDTRVPIRPN
jgi:beta-N-acetylhexosaminidase